MIGPRLTGDVGDHLHDASLAILGMRARVGDQLVASDDDRCQCHGISLHVGHDCAIRSSISLIDIGSLETCDVSR